jgi:DNA topoisomerase-1
MSNKTILVIVESPAKCKKIEKFLSKRKGIDWIVKASFGHITELKSTLEDSIDIKNNFKPSYHISESKKKVVNELMKIAKKKNVEVIIATDPDREGEAIGYHLLKVLNLDIDKTKRIYFNQITEKAVLKSLDNPTNINMNLVNAQQARCILDKLVGYEISPVLWKHVKFGLSAGRCQSPALRLLCDKEEKIKDFDKKSYFKMSGDFKFKDKDFIINSICEKSFNDKNSIDKIMTKFINDKFLIEDIKKSISKRNPSSPFTTSSLQQEASSKLNISPKDCMSLAQKLYENGYITYMRTDSVDLSDESKKNIEEYINNEYGKDYHYNEKTQGVRHKNKTKNSQEAHEAIRPVDIQKLSVPASLTSRAQRLYQLIWKRTISSQMVPHKLEISKVSIISQNTKEIFTTSLENTLFEGFNILYQSNLNKDIDLINFIKNISKGTEISYETIKAEEKYTKPISRYSEASLIKELEKLGIGRPSTYSGIITKIQEKMYVEKKSLEGEKIDAFNIELKNDNIKEKKDKITHGGEKDKLFVTDIGIIVNSFLTKNFSEEDGKGIIDYDMTSNMEEKLDKIAEGQQNWIDTIRNTYNSFHPKVEELIKQNSREKDSYKKILGNDIDGIEIGITMGKNGLVFYKKGKDFKSKWKFAPIENTDNIESVKLEDAQKSLTFPKKIGKIDKKEVTIKYGKFGYYINYNSKNFSLNSLDPLKITVEDAKKIIENGNVSQENADIIGKYDEIDIFFKTGRFGNYLSYKGKNFALSNKNLQKEDIVLEEAISIINKKNKLVLKEFNDELSIRIGKTGPYIMMKKGKGKPTFVSIPKGTKIENLSQEECHQIIENNQSK